MNAKAAFLQRDLESDLEDFNKMYKLYINYYHDNKLDAIELSERQQLTDTYEKHKDLLKNPFGKTNLPEVSEEELLKFYEEMMQNGRSS